VSSVASRLIDFAQSLERDSSCRPGPTKESAHSCADSADGTGVSRLLGIMSRRHPRRFLVTSLPATALARYLPPIHEESVRRGYRFDAAKLGPARFSGSITGTESQLLYEWKHLRRKLAQLGPAMLRASRSVPVPEQHPLFRIVPGKSGSGREFQANQPERPNQSTLDITDKPALKWAS